MSMRLALALAVALIAPACHHDAPPPAAPADVPPLPPSSGTPIGYLLDDATVLKLRDDQRTKLGDIDRSLASELESIDAQLRVANRPAEAAAPPPMGGGRRGRRGGGGMGGGAPSGGGGRHSRGGGGGSGAPSGGGHAADVDRLTESRAADVRDALQRAFALLDDTQRTAATKLLDDHGVDLDAGRPTGAPAPKSGTPDSGDSEEDPEGGR